MSPSLSWYQSFKRRSPDLVAEASPSVALNRKILNKLATGISNLSKHLNIYMISCSNDMHAMVMYLHPKTLNNMGVFCINSHTMHICAIELRWCLMVNKTNGVYICHDFILHVMNTGLHVSHLLIFSYNYCDLYMLVQMDGYRVYKNIPDALHSTLMMSDTFNSPYMFKNDVFLLNIMIIYSSQSMDSKSCLHESCPFCSNMHKLYCLELYYH